MNRIDARESHEIITKQLEKREKMHHARDEKTIQNARYRAVALPDRNRCVVVHKHDDGKVHHGGSVNDDPPLVFSEVIRNCNDTLAHLQNREKRVRTKGLATFVANFIFNAKKP